VHGGFVSVDAARRLYGVVIRGESVDATATVALRADRPESRAFHRKEYVDVLS
jgi:N-methylhydantoinase B